MTTMMFSVWQFLALLGVGVAGVPMPLGVPPLPEDPALLRAAPADTVLYLQWFGAAEPQVDSRNRTERLAAEPEVRAFGRRIGGAIREGILREFTGVTGVGEAVDAIEELLWRPGCLFVTDLAGMLPRAGLVLSLGSGAERVPTLMRKLEGLMASELAPGTDLAEGGVVDIDGVSFRALPLPAGMPVVSWGVLDDYLILTLGEQTPEQIVRGMRGAPGLAAESDFVRWSQRVRVARPSFRSYLDLDVVVALLGMVEPGVAVLLKRLGLDGAEGLMTETGLEGDGFVSRSLLAMAEEPVGFLDLATRRPLKAADVAIVPADATVAAAVRLPPKKAYDLFRSALGALERGAVDEWDEAVARSEREFDLRLEEDLLAHLGDVVTAWSAPSQGGLLVSGLTIAVALDDPEAFGASFEQLMTRASQMAKSRERDEWGRYRRGQYLDSEDVDGRRIYYINLVGDDFPLAPSWCATETHLILSAFPQMLRATIARGVDAADSIADRLLPADLGAGAVSVIDAREVARTVYPLLHPLMHLLAAELQRDGLDVTITALPTQGSILPHLGDERSRLARVDGGVLLTRTGTVPVADPLLGFGVPVGLGAMMFLRYW